MIHRPRHAAPEPGNPLAELLEAAQACHPRWERLGAVTFPGPPPLWASWLENLFCPVLAPALEEALAAAGRGDGAGLRDCDHALEAAVGSAVAAASRAAGSSLAADFPAPAAEKSWRRHAEAVASGRAPGHLAVMFAIRAAAFHLSPVALRAAYLLAEARGGAPHQALDRWAGMADEGLAAFRLPTPALRAA